MRRSAGGQSEVVSRVRWSACGGQREQHEVVSVRWSA